MNREMRRHQAQTKTGKATRTPSIRSTLASSGGTAATRARERGSVLRPTWFRDIWSEMKKVQWPTREEAWHLTWVVVLVSLAVGASLGAIDFGFGWIMEHAILR